jgi:hypothetical protein
MRSAFGWTYQHVNYWVKDPEHLKASPVGSSEYCLGSKTGNCTDINSLLSSLAIASGIPTRMVYGSLLKPTLNGADSDASYHCWVEFFAPQLGWIPVDASLANIYAEEIKLTDANKEIGRVDHIYRVSRQRPRKNRLLLWQPRRATTSVVNRPRLNHATSPRRWSREFSF